MTEVAFVHATANVEDGVAVGAGTQIWARTHVRRGASIGEDCRVGAGVFIDHGVAVGYGCKIQNLAQLFEGSIIGNRVFIGPGVMLTNDMRPRATNDEGDLKSQDDWDLLGVTVRDGASLGAGAVICPGVDVGENSLVGAGAIVTRNVPAHGMVVGNPGRHTGWVCVCARSLDAELRCECGKRFEPDGAGLREVAAPAR